MRYMPIMETVHLWMWGLLKFLEIMFIVFDFIPLFFCYIRISKIICRAPQAWLDLGFLEIHISVLTYLAWRLAKFYHYFKRKVCLSFCLSVCPKSQTNICGSLMIKMHSGSSLYPWCCPYTQYEFYKKRL